MHLVILITLLVLAVRLPHILAVAWMALNGFFVIDGAEITVTDGDSISIRGRRCRLIGHDAPEWDQPQGPAAHRALRSIITGPCLVVPVHHDVYGRMLVHVVSRNGLASWRMVRRGHGFADVWWLRPTMIAARWNNRGMWSTAELIRPDIWRRANPSPHSNRSPRS